jgi:AhpD family alkylhydroperoxidase
MYGYGVSDSSENRTAPQWQEPFSFIRLLYRQGKGGDVALVPLIEYAEASPAVRAVYDDIMKTRGVDWINNFWKALANDPKALARMWQNVKQVMAPGALDPLVKEMIYVAVSATNGCEYCTYSHTAAARKKGMSEAMLMELMAVVGLANETNRLANGLRIDVDRQFKP